MHDLTTLLDCKSTSGRLRMAALAVVVGAAFHDASHAAAYGGTAPSLPATIQAENFDTGGQGVGYRDSSTGNAGAVYRAKEDVDLVSDGASGYVVNNFQTGEWLAYTVNVATAGTYDLELSVSNNYAGSPAYHVEVDGVNVTGSIAVPKTGGWGTFQWAGKKSVQLSAGAHLIKVVADAQYFNLDALRFTFTGASSGSGSGSGGTTTPTPTPYTGTPIAVPATIMAANFDKGGEGVAYHDNVKGNAGGQYRTAEDVDIIAGGSGGYTVNNFETGEWLSYTINVPANGNYDVDVLASSNLSTAAYRILVDGKDVSGSVAVPSTGGWGNFQWLGKKTIALTAGKHVLRIGAAQQYFNLDSVRVASTTSTPSNPGTPSTGGSGSTSIPGTAAWSCDFENSTCGMGEQSKLEGSGGKRSSFVASGRSGGYAVRLHTESGDNNVHGSGDWERNDLSLGPSSSYCNEGQEEWWAHSVMFPSDYVFPTMGIVMDFHHNYSSGQANFELQQIKGTGLRFRGYGGGSVNSGQYDILVSDPYGGSEGITRNKWYDFVYHVKWSSSGNGLMEIWLNGKKVGTYNGPTLYKGISCYFKLANYHSATGASSVIHDRVVRGTKSSDVAITPLQ